MPRYLPADDFYADWARAEFGPEAAAELAALFTRIDCHLPRPADWVHGPGGIRPDSRDWAEVRKEYAFVEADRVTGGQIVIEAERSAQGVIVDHG